MNSFSRIIRVSFTILVLSCSLVALNSGADDPKSKVSKPCVGGKSTIYSCNKVTLQAQIPLSRFSTKPHSASNLWGYVDLDDQREYAVIGLQNGTAVVEVTDPTKPRVIGIVPGSASAWREVKVYSFLNKKTNKWDAYAYITTEALQAGLQIIDLSKLPKSVSLARVDRDINTAHTAFISNVDFATGTALSGLKPYLYLEGVDRPTRFLPQASSSKKGEGCGKNACSTNFPGSYCSCGTGCLCSKNKGTPGFKVLSLANPKDPKLVGDYRTTYMHDVYVETFTGGRAKQCPAGHDPCEVVFGWTGQDFRIIDFTDKSAPVVLSTLTYQNLGYPHSGWISKNKQWVFNFDELDERNTGMRTRVISINIQDFLAPRVGTAWEGSTNAIEHNGYVVGDKLYISSYTRGLVILDIKNPAAPKEIAFFDTYPESDLAEFKGAWGAYPFLPSGNILISDINRGLFILKEQK